MYGKDEHKRHGIKGKESHFLDMINSVNSDGLEDLTWPGSFSSPASKEKETKGKEEVKSDTTQTQRPKTQTQDVPASSPSNPTARYKDKTGKRTAKVKNVQPKSEVEINDEWDGFKQDLTGYKSRDKIVKRYGIYLPERVYNTYHTFFGRDTSAAISVDLQRFMNRNIERMKAELSQRSDLL